MKLVYLANARIPTEKAHGRQIMKMCEAFADAGLEVELVVPWRFSKIKENPFLFYDVKRKFKITKIFSFDLVKFGKIGFLIQIISFLMAAKIYLVFKNFDVLYTREQLVGMFFSNFVLELHSLPKKISKIHKNSWLKANRLIVLTNFIREDLIKAGVLVNKILVAPDCVDLKEFDISITKERARQETNLSDKKIILGYTGSFKTMGMDKGILDILKALRIVLKDRHDIFFLAIGGNEQDIKHYEEIAKDLGVINNISLLPRVSIKKLAIYQKACDVLLMPFPFNQHYAYYMSPLKMFEYMASQRPIIASDLPSVKEVLNSQNSFLCQPDNPKDLSEKISYILNNKSLGERIANQAHLDVNNYTWEKRAEGILVFVG